MNKYQIKFHKSKVWFIRNAMMVLASLILLLSLSTAVLSGLALSRLNHQAAEGRLNTERQLKHAEDELVALKKEFEKTREEGHNERVEILQYIRCILLLPREGLETQEARVKAIDSCLSGSLKKDVKKDQDFLAQ